MKERAIFVWIALGAIALGWFIGRGGQLPELPKLPSPNQARGPVASTGQEPEADNVNELWDQVKGQIGDDPQAAIDTVRMWRDRATREMSDEPSAPSHATPVYNPPPQRHSPVTYYAPQARGGGPVYASVGTPVTWIPASDSLPAEPTQTYLPTHVSVSDPAR